MYCLNTTLFNYYVLVGIKLRKLIRTLDNSTKVVVMQKFVSLPGNIQLKASHQTVTRYSFSSNALKENYTSHVK